MLTERFDDALSYASAVHRTQRRKGAEIPYVSHLLAVCSLAIEAGADEEQAIAALLHDAVEDQGGLDRLDDIRERFGERVAGIVADCTDSWSDPKPEWRDRKESYVRSLADKSPDSLLVSLADKTHNAGAIVHDVRHYGDQVWDRFTGGRDATVWYYRQLSDHFACLLPGPAAARLRILVTEMEALAAQSRLSSG